MTTLPNRGEARARPLAGLDLLRIAAASYIVLFHVCAGFNNPLVATFFSRGPAATSLFFSLSGFLLTHLYLGQVFDDAAQKRFVWRRVARILPANLLGLGCILGWQAGYGMTTDFRTVLEAAVLVQTWKVGESHLLNTPAWSISCLLFFYLTFVALLPRLRAMRPAGLVALGLALWSLDLWLPQWLAGHPGSFDPASWAQYLHNNPLARLPGFVFGIIAALLLRRVERLPRWYAPAILGLVGAVMVLAPQETSPVNNEVFAPLTLALLIAFARPGQTVARLAGRPLVRRLASASLCVFLMHIFHIRVFSSKLLPHLGGQWSLPVVLLLLAVSWGSALLADRYLCRPVTRWLIRPVWPRFPTFTPAPMPSADD